MLTVSTLTYLKMILINSNHLIKSLQPAKKMRDTDISWRMELLEELKKNDQFYKSLPNGIYTGFKAIQEVCPQEGMIALLGYPTKPTKSKNFEYKGYELIYIDHSGKSVFLNEKEAIDASIKFSKSRVEIFSKNNNIGYKPTYNYYENGILVENS